MKLYEVPRNSVVKLPSGEIINFHHVDGMYSYCTTWKKEACHISASAEVEVIGPIKEEQDPYCFGDERYDAN
jgi:hypothetical protein